MNHANYIHYNPVRHGLVKAPKDWAFSNFSRYVERGFYEESWGTLEEMIFDVPVGME